MTFNIYKTLQKKHCYLFFLLTFFIIKSSAQNDTIYFDENWKSTIKNSAIYYRIKPLKIKTKKAIGYNIKRLDSVYIINDYYIRTNKIQFEGFSEDKEGGYLVGNAKWYNENNTILDTKYFNSKQNNKNKFEFPKWPILYLDYKIATKSQLTAGLEFCLDCENKNKLFLGLGFGVTSYNNTYYGLPDLHLSYNTEKFLFFKGGVSDKHAYALAGMTLLNILDLGFGYSQPFDDNKIPRIKGFTFGASFRLSSNRSVYSQIRIM